MSGSGSLVKVGAGVQTLTGSNIGYTGNTTVSAGTLTIQDAVAFIAATGGTVGNNGSAVGFSDGYLTSANTLSIAGGATLNFNVNAPVNVPQDSAHSAVGTYGGTTITGSGTLLKTGTGALALGGQGSATYNTVTMDMPAGSLIDIEGGTAERRLGFGLLDE